MRFLFESNYAHNLFQKIKENRHISETFPLIEMVDNQYALAKNDSLTAVIKIQGVDYAGHNNESIKQLRKIRKQAFEFSFNRLNISVFSMKKQRDIEFDTAEPSNQFTKDVRNIWFEQFSQAFKTDHYIMITVRPQTTVNKLASSIEASLSKKSEQILKETIDNLKSKLSDFYPKQIKGEDLSSFFATLLNGRQTKVKATNWDRTLANQTLIFDKNQPFMEYGRFAERKVSGFLTIKAFPEQLSDQVLSDIYHFDTDFTIYNGFRTLEEDESIELIEKEAKRALNSGNITDTEAKDLVTADDQVRAGKLNFTEHTFNIEVFAENEQELEQKIQEVQTKIERHSVLCFKESVNIEPLFWSRFPTLERLNTRVKIITTDNASNLMTFSQIGEGFKTSTFGKYPVCSFKTEYNSLFDFNFHQSPKMDTKELGHTIIFGGSNSGKSTLISFLQSNCFIYDNFKALNFDSKNGLEVYTNCIDGSYLDFSKNVEMNPFKIIDSTRNRLFLSNWLKDLLQISPDNYELSNQIDDGVKRIFTMPKDERDFDSIWSFFDKEHGVLYEKMRPFFKSGVYGHYFNGRKNSFDFEDGTITFNADDILDDERILPSVTDFIFNQFMSYMGEKNTPHIVFVDELPKYIQTEIFRKKIPELVLEIRKRNGVFVGATNSIPIFKKGFGSDFSSSIANFLIYPDSQAKPEDYIDYLGLTDREFEWVKNNSASSRRVLFKRVQTGESIILNINLAPLGKYLNAFDSSAEKVLLLKELQKTNPTNWKNEYLNFKE